MLPPPHTCGLCWLIPVSHIIRWQQALISCLLHYPGWVKASQVSPWSQVSALRAAGNQVFGFWWSRKIWRKSGWKNIGRPLWIHSFMKTHQVLKIKSMYQFIHLSKTHQHLFCKRYCIHAGGTMINKIWFLLLGSLYLRGCKGLNVFGATV